MVIERYYESQIAAFANRPNAVDSLFYKLLNGPDYSLVRYTVEHTIDFVKGLYQIVSLLQDLPLSKQLSFWTSRMATLLSKPMIQEMLGEEKKNLSPQQIITYGSFIRYHFKNQSEELVEYILSHFQGQN